MKKTTNPYTFLRDFCFRSPILSLNFYKEIVKKSSFELDDLKKLWKKPVIKEAIFLASKTLYDEIEKNISVANDEKLATLKFSFLKYLYRASTRCTPFGLFSGIGVGEITDRTALELNTFDSFKRRTSFDTDFLFNLAAAYSKKESIKKNTIYFPNSSLYPFYNQYRYIDYQSEKNQRSYSIEAVYKNEYLDAIIKKSENGANYNELVNLLSSDKISKEEASDFIDSLIYNKILVNSIEVSITGGDTFDTLISELESCKDSKLSLEKLYSLQKSLGDLDKKIGNNVSNYNEIIEIVKELDINYNPNYLFQTDLELTTTTNEINQKVVYQIKKVIPFLLKISKYQENKNLTRFKNRFTQRYEDQEVLLNEVLDVESGIGYIQNSLVSDTTPFLKDITPTKKKKFISQHELNDAEKIIINKFLASQRNKETILVLNEEDFDNIISENNYLPDTLSAFTEVIQNDNDNLIMLYNLSASAGKLLGRFTHSKRVEEYVKKITAIEQQMHTDKILAEIVHLPESRVGNILRRNHLRDFEIPYISKSTLKEENQLNLNDLLVSVRNNKVILRSKKLQKEILPKLTNAHNYSLNALPVYEFLADLELQNQRDSLDFSWPSIIADNSFLPRVVYKNIILSKAKWILHKDAIPEFLESKHDDTISIIKNWQAENNVPDFIQIVNNDNTLLINLNHLDSVLILKETLRKKEKITLEEFLHTSNTFVSNSNNEYFTNECLFTFYNQSKLNKS
ncbi:lantibiotic dehydratase family protein [Tenacibaculum sp. MEBiC06402]|uniref:lantibiotic dehydratase family protein n=1 Tax=unclassified Tenacibaculum TaxID=2635139 RepID=UPI003B99D2A5